MARTLPPDPSLGQALKSLREERGLTQEAISHEAGVTIGAYGRIERGEVSPTWSTVRVIAKALGISMRELGTIIDELG